MKIWMSESTRKNDNYGLKFKLTIWGIAILIGVLTVSSTFLLLEIGVYSKWIWFVLFVIISSISITLAFKTGKYANRDALIFFKDSSNDLFVLDSRFAVRTTRHILANMERTGLFLKDLKNGLIPELELKRHAQQILEVEKIKPRKDGFYLICQVKYSTNLVSKVSYLFVNGYEDESTLMNEFEKRKNNQPRDEKNYFLPILLSSFGSTGFLVLCVLSHTDVGILPEKIYFPCLTLLAIPFITLVTFIIKRNRGL